MPATWHDRRPGTGSVAARRRTDWQPACRRPIRRRAVAGSRDPRSQSRDAAGGGLLQTSATWITVLKWAGGAYLVWLGIQVWRSPPIALEVGSGAASTASGATLFRQGAFSALTNPKALLFFAAFLPQFIDPARSLLVQFAIMAGTFAVLEIITEFVIASFAQRVSPWLARVGRRFNRACGGIFMAIGIALPLRG